MEWKLPINYTFHPGDFEMLAEITHTTVVHYHQQGGYCRPPAARLVQRYDIIERHLGVASSRSCAFHKCTARTFSLCHGLFQDTATAWRSLKERVFFLLRSNSWIKEGFNQRICSGFPKFQRIYSFESR